MARALLVGCGCRARGLGRELLEAGWLVRGTTRDPDQIAEIEAAGIEAASADPNRVAEILELIGDVTVLCWLLGSAEGEEAELAALHGERLERLLEEIVDTPVRAFVYEAAGSVSPTLLDSGAELALAAEQRWRIPVRLLTADPADHAGWQTGAVAAVTGAISGR